MKKTLLLLFLLFWQLHAMDRQSTLKIYHEIFSTLTQKKQFTVYTKNREYREVFSHSNTIRLVNTIEAADIILVTQKSMLDKVSENKCQNKILFATQYSLLKHCKYIIGALYWRRGRIQLHFIKNRFQGHNIVLPPKYQKFVRDKL